MVFFCTLMVSFSITYHLFLITSFHRLLKLLLLFAVPTTSSDESPERFAGLGTRAELRCPAPGLRPPVTYEWRKQGGQVAGDTTRRGVREEKYREHRNEIMCFVRFLILKQSSLVFPNVRAQHAGTYVCRANSSSSNSNSSFAEVSVVLVVTGLVPYFAQAPVSYMALETLPESNLNFDLEISFKPEAANGQCIADLGGIFGAFTTLTGQQKRLRRRGCKFVL